MSAEDFATLRKLLDAVGCDPSYAPNIEPGLAALGRIETAWKGLERVAGDAEESIREDYEAVLAVLGPDDRDMAHICLRHLRDMARFGEYVWDGGFECTDCGRLTNNGTCTECRHNTSPIKKARAEIERLQQERDDLARQLERHNEDAMMEPSLRAEVERLRAAIRKHMVETHEYGYEDYDPESAELWAALEEK